MRLMAGLIIALCVIFAGADLFADGPDKGCDGEKCRPLVKRIVHHVRKVFAEKDTDGDGALTLEEWGGRERIFRAMDRDADGKVTPREMAAFILKQAKQKRQDKSQ